MANITQQPNLYNSAYVPNVWVLDGIGSADRYTLTVEIDGNAVATIKQPANPVGVGIFDVSKILQSYLSESFVELTQRAADTPGAFMSYRVIANTETGTAPSENPVTSSTKYVINAYGNWRDVNMDLSAFLPNPATRLCESNSNIDANYAKPVDFLTNYPEAYTVHPNEYKTLSFFARNTNFGPNWGPNEAPFFVSVRYYNAAGVEVVQGIYALSLNNGSSLRTDCDDMGVNITNNNSITTIAAGPQNMIDDGITWDPTWASYKIEVYSYNHCSTTTIQNCGSISEMANYLGDVIYTADFNVDYSCEKFEPVTVSFMNQYGVRDYFTMTKRNTRQVTTQRNSYTKSLGTWSDLTYSIRPTERGHTTFSSTSDTEMTLSTDWMSDDASKWLQELYTSPSVMVYVDGRWEPAQITTNLYEQKTYARQQLFQHFMTVKFANNQKIQRG